MKNALMENNPFIKKYSIPLFLVLIAAGIAGNYFNFSIFLNIEFIFGSIFAMLALQYLGSVRGVSSAAVIACSTYILWNHPYAVIILTAEVTAVSWLINRRKMGLVLADTLYWFLIGMPLTFIFYLFVMKTPFSNTYIAMTIMSVNGIVNALIARLIYTFIALRTRTPLISFREIIYNMLTLFVLISALIMLAAGSRADFIETELQIRTSLIQNNRRLTNTLERWVINRKSAIINLAVMSSSRSPIEMQPYLEQAKKSDVNLIYIGLQDKDAITTAIFPLIDELGQNNLGKNFADRPYIQKLRQTLKPMLSEVVLGKFDKPKPLVAMLAPVVIQGKYSGYVFGVLGLEQIREQLEKSSDQNAMLYTLIDKNGNVIMTNRKDQKEMSHFARGKGTLNNLDTGISQWVPALLSNTPTSERWLKSFYVSETSIGDLAEWKLILEQPVAPFQKKLYNSYSNKLILLLLILVIALALAEFLSRRIVATIEKLRLVTRDLPLKLASGNSEIVWPETSIKDTNDLISNFRHMADSLTLKFNEVRQINESLDQRVQERTLELRNSEQRLAGIIRGTNAGTWEWNIPRGEILINNRWAEIIGYTLEEITPLSIESWAEFIYPEDLARCNELLKKHFHDELDYLDFEMRIKHKNGTWVWVLDRGKVTFRSDDGKPLLMQGTHQDITERKLAEEKIKEISIRDPLTDTYNRRYIFERLEIIIVEFLRENKIFTISIVDLDHFKKINDRHGHQAGDFILKEFTRIISDNLRPYDLLGRYGGEEFIIVTMNSNREQTKLNMERIQNIVRNKTFIFKNIEIRFTFSCGISDNMEFSIENISFENIIGKADERLYEAKKTGRDKVVI